MTDCDRIIPLLSLYLEGETSPTEATQIRGHLKACAECRSEYGDLKATVELVRALPQISASEDFEAGVLARLRSAGVAEVGAQPTRRDAEELVPSGPARGVVLAGDWGRENWWDGWLPRFAAAAAAAAVVAVSMVGTHQFAQHQKEQAALAARSSAPAEVSASASSTRPSTTPATSSELASLDAASGAVRNPQYDDLRSRFPDIPAEVIRAMPLNGETYAADRMVAQPWTSAAGGQLLAPVDYHGEDKVYIYR